VSLQVSDVMVQRLHWSRCKNSLQIRTETRCNAAGFATSRQVTTRYDFAIHIHPRRMQRQHA
jgi:hypothetical protein